ncbi:MAG TPA: XRE family transcriptional regulator [Ruminococcaceae bacterium]|nr:XRE family transcriptional regulator [Oscillospiraceae bacterium]
MTCDIFLLFCLMVVVIMCVSIRIKTIIKEKGLKQKEFAKSITVTESYISKLIRNESGLSNSTAALIEEIHGYSAQWILTGKGNKYLSSSQDSSLSLVKRKVISEIEGLTDDEVMAVMAFMKTFKNVKIDFPEKE